MGVPVIEVCGVWFSFDGLPVLEDVNLTVKSGDFLAVIGPNGGGKTTLVRVMLGLLQPDRGRIRVFGGPPESALHRIGYVPQDIGLNVGFPISVEDVVLMGRLRGGGGWRPFGRADRKAVQEAMEQMRVWEFRRRHIGELSGGQRQRVFVARALVSNPEALILDEPTASVDTRGQTEFYHLLKELNRKVTIVVVSHDLMVLSSHVKSVACVNRQVFFHDAPEITRDMLEMAYHCPVELVAHGLPHRVLPAHQDE